MATLVIKNLPDRLHVRLKEQAERNRRSLTQEAISVLESGVTLPRIAPTLPPPLKLSGGPLTTDAIEAAIEAGRN